MNQKGVLIYFRTANGKGEKIEVDQKFCAKNLFMVIGKKMKTQVDQIRLFHRSNEIKCSQTQLTFKNQDIIHVLRGENLVNQPKMLKIMISWQNNQYVYHLNRLSTISQLKKQMEKDIAKWNKRIILSYLGRQLKDQQTLVDAQIQNNSKLSICMVINEKVQNIQILKYNKSDCQALQKKEPKNVTPIKIQLNLVQKKKQKQIPEIPSPQLFVDLKKPWFSGKKIIQTQSVNCDQSNDDNNPDLWIDCSFIATNSKKTKTYTFDCNEKHKISDVIKKLAKVEICQKDSINWLSKGQIEDMQENNLLQIARQRANQILGPYKYRIKN